MFEKARKFLTLQAVHRSNLTFVCTAPRWVMNVLKQMVKMGEKMLSGLGVIGLIIDGEAVFKEVKHLRVKIFALYTEYLSQSVDLLSFLIHVFFSATSKVLYV